MVVGLAAALAEGLEVLKLEEWPSWKEWSKQRGERAGNQPRFDYISRPRLPIPMNTICALLTS